MNEPQVLERLSTLLGEVLGVDDLALRPETTAKEVPGWDSLSNVRFILAVQQAFKVRLSAGEVGRLKQVGDLAALLTRRSE